MRLGRFDLLLFFCLGFSVIMPTPVVAENNRVTPMSSFEIMSSWVMKPPPLPKNASRLTGKVCDITGKPIQLLSLRFMSESGHFFPKSMNAHMLRSDKNGDYYYDIPAEYLPDTFHIRKRGYYEYIGEEEIIPSNFKNLHQIVYIKKNETVHLDLMIDELPRTRPWWHFKYNTGKCNAPWPF
jgi:hypothetical protein